MAVIRIQTAQTDLLHPGKIAFYERADAFGNILVT